MRRVRPWTPRHKGRPQEVESMFKPGELKRDSRGAWYLVACDGALRRLPFEASNVADLYARKCELAKSEDKPVPAWPEELTAAIKATGFLGDK